MVPLYHVPWVHTLGIYTPVMVPESSWIFRGRLVKYGQPERTSSTGLQIYFRELDEKFRILFTIWRKIPADRKATPSTEADHFSQVISISIGAWTGNIAKYLANGRSTAQTPPTVPYLGSTTAYLGRSIPGCVSWAIIRKVLHLLYQEFSIGYAPRTG